MATDTASRASMDHQGLRSEGASADRARAKNTLEESMRKTAGEGAVAFYARKNPAINPRRTHLNIDRVNDGAGGFKDATSITEVLNYVDGRRSRLTRELKDGHRHAVTTVVHLPHAYIEPDGTKYHARDERTGKEKFYRDGSPVMVERYRIRPDRYKEAMRFFDSYTRFHAELLPGGHAAIAGYSINLDESRPHMQLFSDPYSADISKKHPDGLKNSYQEAFGTHRKDRKVVQLDRKTGEPVVDPKTGKPKMVAEGGSRKMERYHRELKAHLLAEGFEIEAERDELRHDRRLDLDDFKDLADEQHNAFEAAQQVGDEAAELDAAIARHRVEMELEAKESDARAERGYQEGRAEGLVSLDAEREELNRRVGVIEERERAVATTEQQAAELLAAAEEKAASARAAGYNAGHAEGLDAGRAEGRQQAREAYLSELERVRADREAAAEDRAAVATERQRGYSEGHAAGLAAVEDLKKEAATAIEDGRKAGYDAGYTKGRAEGRRAEKEVYDLKVRRLADREAAAAKWETETEPALRAAIEDAMRDDREAAAADRDAAAQLRENAKIALAEAERRRDAVPEYDPIAAVQAMQAARFDAGEQRQMVVYDDTGEMLRDEDGKLVMDKANAELDREAARLFHGRTAEAGLTVKERSERRRASLRDGTVEIGKGAEKNRQRSNEKEGRVR